MDVSKIMEWSANDNRPSSTTYSSNIVNQYTAATGARLEFGYDYMGGRVFKKVRQGDLLVKHLIFAYEPFGQCRHAGTFARPFRFSSDYHDDETGLLYYNYRHYSPNLGRWISRDPVGEEGGDNLYSFADNNGICRSDILGLDYRGILGNNQCCHNGTPLNMDADMVRDANGECRLLLSRVYITENWAFGLHKNICVDDNCYSFGLDNDTPWYAPLLACFSSEYAHVYSPKKYTESGEEILVRKSYGDLLKSELDFLNNSKEHGKGLYSIFVINLFNNSFDFDNCRSFTFRYWNQAQLNRYYGDIPPENNSFIPLWRKSIEERKYYEQLLKQMGSHNFGKAL